MKKKPESIKDMIRRVITEERFKLLEADDFNITDSLVIQKIKSSIEALYRKSVPTYDEIENLVRKNSTSYRIEKVKSISGNNHFGVRIWFNGDEIALPAKRAKLYPIK